MEQMSKSKVIHKGKNNPDGNQKMICHLGVKIPEVNHSSRDQQSLTFWAPETGTPMNT